MSDAAGTVEGATRPGAADPIRVYCPTHNLRFSTAHAPQIRCKSGGHELDQDFPRAEFWEYCCDCQSFAPSGFARGATHSRKDSRIDGIRSTL